MKPALLLLFISFSYVQLFAQQADSINVKKDSAFISNDTVGTIRVDSLSLLLKDSAHLAVADSISQSLAQSALRKDSIKNKSATYNLHVQQILKLNRFLNTSGKPVAMVNRIKNRSSGDSLFYLLASIALLLGFFRFFYARYFNNVFRVFFNASLRQSQLTDQLLQAKLPSLLFNLLFVLIGGVYVYLLLRYYDWISAQQFWTVLAYCVISLAIIYLVKFVSVKFTGWLTGYNAVTDTYIFIIFLINKILAILLVPFSIVIAFALPSLATAGVIISLLLIGLMFLLRFFRSYGLLQHQLKISRLHFFMYVAGVEVLPVLLIYKGLVLLLSKNL